MKVIKFFIVAALLFLPHMAYSADVIQEIIVSADATSRESGIQKALDLATMQAVGVLSSALDGEVVAATSVRQPIPYPNVATINEVFSEPFPKQLNFVVLRANINLTQLQAQLAAQNKTKVAVKDLKSLGVQHKFAELNAKNEVNILNKMFEHLEALPDLFDYEMVMEKRLKETSDRRYSHGATVYLVTNENTNRFAKVYCSVMSLISMSHAELKVDKRLGRYHFTYYLPNAKSVIVRNNYRINERGKVINQISKRLGEFLKDRMFAFNIADNVSSPTKLEVLKVSDEIYMRTRNKVGRIAGKIGRVLGSAALVLATGGAGWGLMEGGSAPTKIPRMFDYVDHFTSSDAKKVGEIYYGIYIPANKLNTYRDFRIVKRR